MTTRADSRPMALKWLAAFAALTISTFAFAAWPDSYEGRIANLNALRQDMAYPGIPHDAKRTKRLYEAACSKKSSSACSYESWWNPQTGGDLAKARHERAVPKHEAHALHDTKHAARVRGARRAGGQAVRPRQ